VKYDEEFQRGSLKVLCGLALIAVAPWGNGSITQRPAFPKRRVPLVARPARRVPSQATVKPQAFEFNIHVRRDLDEKLEAIGIQVKARDIEDGVVYEPMASKSQRFSSIMGR
jgi:hypothetical protein